MTSPAEEIAGALVRIKAVMASSHFNRADRQFEFSGSQMEELSSATAALERALPIDPPQETLGDEGLRERIVVILKHANYSLRGNIPSHMGTPSCWYASDNQKFDTAEEAQAHNHELVADAILALRHPLPAATCEHTWKDRSEFGNCYLSFCTKCNIRRAPEAAMRGETIIAPATPREASPPQPARAAEDAPFKFACDVCGEVLTTPGGLAFSPPNSDGMVRKFHICAKHDIAELLRAALSAMRDVPRGMRLVPEEPTEAMIQAGIHAWRQPTDRKRSIAYYIWDAMLAASPPADKVKGGGK